ncbi:hypothetical protein A2641_02545 [Candidatus Nomurabacteria bacterium RIFCSPHIGHO2_01_FULL_37_25]|uniref:Uncharacterized protein n=1 Tax=Candidatus Nomurabacteria bacterium RIFCSPLOWO2_01_FULL_36_16 TaxID=1801767 RepID=A0A1F6X0I0_9BACT|nr:MAG: hypothetical protein A2641_02545 [Candidatus Nomurabacteria bacterium RIFCSPHIGHO2_01_FULL_37_25]OGI75033.1 MAG: hypothetical protein A3D36_03290 [Candidatus Nomurabacteria bacterium RIFCSPHIGHO2_02_FULL_36_29]OGI87544.1 MAG: hypothetical protein A3A91_01360 [Candidatus Nomurabacteria bacterium RIFCSPLOWO2_01_FULL_36_16]OGI96765.1 MAG: hypothetical protein A3I84_02295 [Candidatus Nomurabacteria bacterium RIFCSPLOWO2_02_FULL_36_8]
MSKEIIQGICKEIDNIVLENKRDYSYLRELIMKVIVDDKNYPKRFVDMIDDIHEDDSFTAETEEEAKEYNSHSPEQFIIFLKQSKEKNIEFWRSEN